jgi:predicted RNase H-like nuclease
MKVAGADVWKGQWVVVVLDDGLFDTVFLVGAIDVALDRVPEAVVIAIDMPIGLPDPGERRAADQLARTYVGPRWQSVFMTPSLDLLEAETHAKANQLAVAEGRDGISAQAYALRTMIRQVQPVAAHDHRVHEVHPEVSFVRANSDVPLPWSKSSWNGINIRRRILESQQIVLPDDLSGPGGAGFADILDAAIAAWSAVRIAAGRAESLPPNADRVGAIWS